MLDYELLSWFVLLLAYVLIGVLVLGLVLWFLDRRREDRGNGDGGEDVRGGFPPGELYVPEEWSGAPQTGPEEGSR